MTDLTASAAAAPAEARDFLALLKPRVMSLVVFTAAVALILAPGEIHPVIALTAILCVAVGAGAAGAINMWYDRDIDAVMARTAARPIPSGRVHPDDALGFGIVLAIGSVTVMGLAVNPFAAALLAGSILFYVVVYTMWLKRRTAQNIVIGGAAGAFPPVIGWAAATGDAGLLPWLLFLVIFIWTPPHFWALALYRSADYARAGVPMLPVTAGDRATRRQIMAYSVGLAAVSLAPAAFGLVGLVHLVGASLLACWLLAAAWAVLRGHPEDHRPARRLFAGSILYLFLYFLLLPLDLAAQPWLG